MVYKDYKGLDELNNFEDFFYNFEKKYYLLSP